MRSRSAFARTLGLLTVLLLSPSAYSVDLNYSIEMGIEHNDNVRIAALQSRQ